MKDGSKRETMWQQNVTQEGSLHGEDTGYNKVGNAVASGQGTLFASYILAMGDLLTAMKWRVGRQEASNQPPTAN